MVPLAPSSPIEFVRRFVRNGAISVSPSAKEPRMNNMVTKQKASTYQPQNMVGYLLELCHHFNLVPVPLKLKSKVPLVRWSHESWKPSPVEIEAWSSRVGLNCSGRCGEKLAVKSTIRRMRTSVLSPPIDKLQKEQTVSKENEQIHGGGND